jgi:hypothetical protein
MKMFGSVLVLRRVAAPDVSAFKTETQMHPTIVHLQAFFTAARVRSDAVNVIEMCAFLHCGPPRGEAKKAAADADARRRSGWLPN